MKNAHQEITQRIPILPYERKGHGVTRDIKVNEKVTLRRSQTSYCSGVVFEYLYLLLRKYKKWNTLTSSTREELYRYCYVRTDLSDDYFWGLPEGLIKHRVAHEVQPEQVDEKGFYFGQLYDWKEGDSEPILGHAVVCIKPWKNKSNNPAIWTFSSDNIALHKTGEDYWSVEHPRRSRTREWYIAKLNESWLTST